MTRVEDDDEIGVIVFNPADGNDMASEAARIGAYIDGDPGGDDTPGRLVFATTADEAASATERMRIDSVGTVYIGDTANDNMTQGLTIDQGAADNQILTLRSDVASGLTANAIFVQETYDYLTIQKNHATLGGAAIQATSPDHASAAVVLKFVGLGGTAQTYKTTAHSGLMEFQVAEHDGAGALADVTDGGNAYTFRAQRGGSMVALLHIDEDGDFHVTTLDGSSVAGTAFADHEDDEMLIRAHHLASTQGRNDAGIIRDEWDKFIRYNEEDLIRVGVISDTIANGGMTNQSQLIRLYGGAIWQAATKRKALEARVETLEQRLLAAGA
jgi:hypothetical protein